MRKSRFTESQVVAILKEGEAGVSVAQLSRTQGISPATYYHWKSKYAEAGVSELKRFTGAIVSSYDWTEKPREAQPASQCELHSSIQLLH